MKIGCGCGNLLCDNTDYLPYKAHLISDQDWFNVLDAIDDAIEKSGPSAKEKEAACMSLRCLIGNVKREAWQCGACGRVYIDDQAHQLREFIPGPNNAATELFRRRSFQGQQAESDAAPDSPHDGR